MNKSNNSKEPEQVMNQGTAKDSHWLDMISMAIRTPVFDHQRSVFTNRTMRFGQIEAVGFDFDHTLAVYNCEALDALATA